MFRPPSKRTYDAAMFASVVCDVSGNELSALPFGGSTLKLNTLGVTELRSPPKLSAGVALPTTTKPRGLEKVHGCSKCAHGRGRGQARRASCGLRSRPSVIEFSYAASTSWFASTTRQSNSENLRQLGR